MSDRLSALQALPAFKDLCRKVAADPSEPSNFAALHFLAFEQGCEALDKLAIGERRLTVNACWEESVRLLEQRRRGLPPPTRRRPLPPEEAKDVESLKSHIRRFAPHLDPRLACAMVEFAPKSLPPLAAPLQALQGKAGELLADFFKPAPSTPALAEALLLSARGVLASREPVPAGQRLGAEAYVALALLMLDVPALAALPAKCRPFAADAEAALERYTSALNAGPGVEVAQDALFDPVALIPTALVFSVRGKHEEAAGLLSCARKFPACSTPASDLSNATMRLKELEDDAKEKASSERPSARASWEAEKARLANDALKEGGGDPAENGLLPLPAMDALMGLIGLEGVKQGARALYDRVLVARRSGTKGPPPNVPLNFRLLGNPGTGKSVVSRLVAQLLVELGLRPGEGASAAAAAAAAGGDAGAEERARQARVASEIAEQAASIPAVVAAGEVEALGTRAECVRIALTANEAAPLSAIGSAGLHQAVLDTAKQSQAGAMVELRRLVGDLAAKAEAAKRSKKAADDADAKRRGAAKAGPGGGGSGGAAAAATGGGGGGGGGGGAAAGGGGAAAAGASGAGAAAAGAGGGGAAPAPAQLSGPKRFVETSGGKLQQDGVESLEEIVEGLLAASPPGGTIFIDEAHQLAGADPTGKSAPVVKRLVKYSEDHRAVLTFILAGYPDPMQSLLDMDVGLARRFPELPTNCFRMPDYTAGELAAIFRSKVEEKNKRLDAEAEAARAAHAPPPPPERWHLEDPKTAEIVGRRLARGAGCVGFGNGGAVDTLLNGTIRSRMDRRLKRAMLEARARGVELPRNEYFTIKLEDVLGPKPDVKKSAAFEELDAMVGLQRVKEEIAALLRHLDAMWQAEAKCEEPLTVPRLNRIFSGGPGCGKTTVAVLYGRILAECGFLSSGEVEVYKPSDFLGSALGESEKKTAAILDRCKGKVLVIDEAYGLGVATSAGSKGGGWSSSYHEAVQTALAAGVPAEAGADMCVCMLGYPDAMDK